jgi:hypothetical protein
VNQTDSLLLEWRRAHERLAEQEVELEAMAAELRAARGLLAEMDARYHRERRLADERLRAIYESRTWRVGRVITRCLGFLARGT